MRRLGAIAALLLGACAHAVVQPPAPARLTEADVRLGARLLAMADSRRLDTSLTRTALASARPWVRAEATLALGQVGDAAARPSLAGLLSDGDTAVAASAAYALGLQRDSSAVATLARALDGPSSIATEAAWSLGEIGEPARGAIVDALGARSRPGAVRAMLLLAASKLRPVPVASIIPFFSAAAATGTASPDESRVLWAASYAVSRRPTPSAARALLALAEVPDAETRANVARGLARSAVGDSLVDPGFGALVRLARDADAHVRINALRSLGGYGDRARDLVAGAARDGDANVRITAAQALGTLLAADDARWPAVWQADTGFMYRRSLLASAVHAGASLPAVDEWGRAGDWRLRAAVADAAGGAVGWAATWRLAAPLLRDADPRVRESALGSLDPFADSSAHADARQSMLAALDDPDFFTRATALAALVRHPSAAEAHAVLASWRRATADSGNDARIAAIRYLAAAWRADSLAFPDSLRVALRAVPAPADPLERAEGKGIALFASWPGTEGTPRPAAWYERIVRDVVAPSLSGRPLRAEIATERGTITLELYGADAPITVDNFATLARQGYYRNVRFHRVVPNFVAQDGDPRGDGNGGPGYAIRDEFNRRRYDRGAVGMALSGPDTGGSQYFITHSPQPHLDGHYTVFGQVIAGWEVLDRLVQGDRITGIVIR